MTKIPPRLKASARALRRHMTDAERALWTLLRTYRPRFNHQFAAAGFVLDFACRKARVAIELDGGQHDGSGRDARRTEALEKAGWKVLRFWNHDVLQNRDGVLEVILAAVAARVPNEEAHPRPRPAIREGRVRRPRRRVPKKGAPPAPPGNPGGE